VREEEERRKKKGGGGGGGEPSLSFFIEPPQHTSHRLRTYKRYDHSYYHHPDNNNSPTASPKHTRARAESSFFLLSPPTPFGVSAPSRARALPAEQAQQQQHRGAPTHPGWRTTATMRAGESDAFPVDVRARTAADAVAAHHPRPTL
jgi:hypothetical protein